MTHRRFAILGDPVAHSLSPRLYDAAFAHLKLSVPYETYRIPLGEEAVLCRAMRDIASGGGGNVTVPHKEVSARCLDIRSPAVDRTGACNCFWSDEAGRLAGDNTDVGGFLAAAGELEGLRLAGAAVLLLGAGGAARAVAAACETAGVRRLHLLNRTTRRAETLIFELGLAEIASVCPKPEAEAYDLVVNATSLGLDPSDPLPLALEGGRFAYAIDLVYGPGGTAWTRHASASGVRSIDGLSMLVHQALLSLERWYGPLVDPDGTARAMWSAVAPCLARPEGER